MDFSKRFQWIRRPRWWLVLALVGSFFGWLLWPIQVYHSDVNNFLMVAHEEKPELLGVVRLDWSDSPWKARDQLEHWVADQVAVRKIVVDGRTLWWSETFSVPEKLAFARQNAVLVLEPTDEFLGLERGEPEWASRVERFAVEVDDELREGSLGGKELEAQRLPRFRLRYGEQIEKLETRVKALPKRWFP